jgi:hypothetical protein
LDKGILLIALGHHYTKLAFNMALSIKKFSDIKIAVITDSDDEELLAPFDQIITPKIKDYLEGYVFNPFKLKTYIYDYTPFDHTIYLDVDGMALKDLTPLFKYDFKIQEVAKYNYENAHTCDMVWVTKVGKRLNDIFNAYRLNPKTEYPEYNSSIVIFKKNSANKEYFDLVKKNYFDRKLDFKPIGGLYPDELAWNLSSAQLGHYTDTPEEKPIYFFWEDKNQKEIDPKFYILGMAGGYHKTKLKSVYELSMKQISPYWKFDSMKKIFHNK